MNDGSVSAVFGTESTLQEPKVLLLCELNIPKKIPNLWCWAFTVGLNVDNIFTANES